MLHKLELSETKEPKTAEPETAVDSTPTNEDNRTVQDESVVTRPKKSTPMKKPSLALVIGLCVVAIAAGVGTGFGSYKLFAGSSSTANTGVPADGEIQQVATGKVSEGEVFGSADETAFKDHAKGYLEKGGLDGEGSHKLLRPGGESQTVYLTSSVTDLDTFDGMEVEIWGETFSGQKAGWLMDVGRVKVVKVKGENPNEE